MHVTMHQQSIFLLLFAPYCSDTHHTTPHHNTPFDAESFDLFAGRMMLDSTFGHKDSVQVVEWLNMNHVNESSVVLAMPVKDGSLTLQARCLNPKP